MLETLVSGGSEEMVNVVLEAVVLVETGALPLTV